MKKLISLLFVSIILCSTMVSCTKTEDIPYICYTVDESLSARDIDFLNKMSNTNKHTRTREPGGEPLLGSIIETHHLYNKQQEKLFYIENDLDTGYYICLYSSDNFAKNFSVLLDRVFATDLSAKYITWYIFDNCVYEYIPRELNGKKLTDVYFLCDSVIKRDLVVGKDYNIDFTFYYNVGVIEPDYYYTGTQIINSHVRAKMLCYRSATITKKHLEGSEYLFMTTYFKDWISSKAIDFVLHVDENDVVYILLENYDGDYEDGKAIKHDWHIQAILGSYYEIFLPYFERLDEFQKYQAIGIRLDVFEKLAFKNNN